MSPLHSHKLTATLQHTLAGSADSPQTNPLVSSAPASAVHLRSMLAGDNYELSTWLAYSI